MGRAEVRADAVSAGAALGMGGEERVLASEEGRAYK